METLTEIKETPLSNEDINIMLNGTKIFKYPDLEDMNSIDEIFDDQGRAVMLFLTKDENTGHWISLHKKENIIYYFDPYGYDVDEEKEFIPDYKLEELNQEQPFLMDLFKKSKYKVYSNQYAFQNRNAKNVNTCGRHCVGVYFGRGDRRARGGLHLEPAAASQGVCMHTHTHTHTRTRTQAHALTYTH